MITLAIGVIVSAALYIVATYGFVWAGMRRMEWGERHGVALSPEPKVPSLVEIWSLHGVEMTMVYGMAFVVLTLFELTIWQRLGFAVFGALVFSYLWMSHSPVTAGLPGVSAGRKLASNFGYWCLSVADWLGYFGVLCFGTAIVIEVL